jgi:prepilin-type processing-associated H-X9-DG protein
MRRRINVAVLMSILLVSGFLVVSAVMSVRETQSRVKCRANLWHLGSGIGCYMSAYQGRLPAATVYGTELPPEQRLSWLVEIYPFVECAPIAPCDTTKPWDADVNRPHWRRVYLDKRGEKMGDEYWGHFNLGLCPSRPNEPLPGAFSDSHYVGIAGIGTNAASLPIDAPAIGIFGYDRTLRFIDIKGDLSNTLMVIETGFANGPWVASGFPTVRGVDPDGSVYLGTGGQFGGIHRDGANALFADWAVRFLSNDISRSAFETMSTIERHIP